VTNHRGPSVLGTLFRYEMRMLLRDTRTILIAIVAPLVMFPAYILVVNYVDSREQQALEEETYVYAVYGSRAEWAEDVVKAAIALDESDPDTSRAPVSFELQTPPDPMGALEAGDIHLVVEGLSAPEWDSIRAEEREVEEKEAEEEALEEGSSGGRATEADTAQAEEEPSLPAVRILYRGNSDFSEAARSRLRERILEVRATRRDSVLLSSGFPVAMSEVAPVEAESVASAAKASGVFLGVALTPILVILMLSGGSIVAVDAICGEKERGTLETLLTTAASRTDIVRAKLMAVVVVGLAVAVINVTNLLVYITLGVLDLPPDFVVEVSPLGLLLLLALLVPVAVLVAAALLLLSGASKSYREYQVFFFPVFVAFAISPASRWR
jgi:sodium transport system permease protein